jgi:hypothetical protein
MKRLISLIIISTLLALSAALPVSGAPLAGTIRVLVNNQLIKFPDAQPFIDANGRTQVPARFVSEALGGTVAWDAPSRTVNIIRGSDSISLKVGERAITVNGQSRQLDTAALIKQERTFVPLRFVSEALGAQVTWEAPILTATITTSQPAVSGATVVSKGYTIPLGTGLVFRPDNYTGGSADMNQVFYLNYLKDDPEAQKVALRSALASRFGDGVAEEIYQHVLPKKQRYDLLPEKIMFVEAQKQYIYVVGSSASLIEIYIYNPGYSPYGNN